MFCLSLCRRFILKLSIKNRSRAAALLLLFVSISSLYGFHNVSMWQKASTLSNDGSASLSAFVEASDWLSKKLGQDEIALVPMRDVFYALNPQMRDKLIDYKSLWSSAGVILQANTTKEEVLKVRSHFIYFLKENPLIKYVVRDWVDPYAKRLFEAVANDELIFLLREVKTIPFTLSTGWSSKVTIYERVQYTTLFAMSLASPPRRSFTLPDNASIQYSWSGTTIQKVGPQVGFYLPLEGGIDSSKQNYLIMQIKPDIENLGLLINFYYDKNRDGGFDYERGDYTKSVIFNQTQQGWVKGEWNKIAQIIPKADDPVVQIAIIMTGDNDGAITLSDLIVYTEITPDLVLIEASQWLSENLNEDEFALVPAPAMFYLAKPELRYKLVNYRSLWTSAEIILRANITNDEVLKVRSYFVEFIIENSSAKYIVRDWVDPYAERLFEALVSDELMFLLREVKAMFYTLGRGWSRKITIYERVQYTTLFTINFSARPEGSFTIPSNASIQFHSNGTTIQKVGPQVGFYLPLEGGINASKQNYFTMQFKLDVENLDLMIIFYYDKNRDGKFSNYTVDYTKTLLFSQTQQGWVKGEWNKIAQTIPKADDPIVHIAIIMTGDNDGAITLSNLIVYTETSEG